MIFIKKNKVLLKKQLNRLNATAKKFEETCKTVERWYKGKYNVTKISEEFIEKLSKAPKHEDHHLPLPNQFISTDFQIKPPPKNTEHNKHPHLIKVSFCLF